MQFSDVDLSVGSTSKYLELETRIPRIAIVGAGFVGSATYLRESAKVQITAPNNTTSLIRNCPGNQERAENPSPACHTPGVVMTKLRVVRNIPIPASLPTI